MPGRKSNISTTSNGADEASEINAVPRTSKENKEKEGLSVEDISLPRSMIARLAKGVLPPNTQIHRDALLALHKSASVFVSYVASNSNEIAQAGGKKTIMPPDVVAALKDAEFESFLPRLEAELKKYNDTQCDKRNNYRRKVKEEKAAAAAKEGGDSNEVTDTASSNLAMNGHAGGGDDGVDVSRPFKKFRTATGVGVPREDIDALDIEDDEDGEQDADDQDDQDDEDDVEDDAVEDEVFEDAEETAHADDTMHDVEDNFDGREATRDEALDEPDSD